MKAIIWDDSRSSYENLKIHKKDICSLKFVNLYIASDIKEKFSLKYKRTAAQNNIQQTINAPP